MSKYEALLSLAEFILPASFLEYFDVIDVKSEKESLHIYLFADALKKIFGYLPNNGPLS